MARVTVRDMDNAPLGVVGASWEPVQNAIAFDILQPLVDARIIDLDTAGSLSGGSRVYMSGKIAKREAEVVPGDVVTGNLLAYNYHGGNVPGSKRFGFKQTGVRVVCTNTFGMATRGDDSHAEGFSEAGVFFTHQSGVTERVKELKNVIAEQAVQFTSTVEMFKHMASRQLNPEKYFEDLLGITERREEALLKGETAPGTGRITMGRLLEAYNTQPGQQYAPGSAWQAFNAVTFFVDHKRGTDIKRKENSLFGDGARIRSRAFELAMAA